MSTGLKAVVNALHDDPEDAIAAVSVVPQAPPDRASLKPTDVIINVRSSSVSWVDVLMTSGQYQHQPKVPYTPGMEYAGEVLWAGPECSSGVREGDEVFVDIFNAGPRTGGDYQQYGGLASFAVAPESGVRRVPPQLSLDQAATFSGAYETAHHVLVKCGELQAGETVLIHGATGGTGLAAVQIARALGAKIIATGGSDEKLAVVAHNAGDALLAAVNYRAAAAAAAGGGGDGTGTSSVDRSGGAQGGFKDAVRAATGGKGVDVVYDGVGGAVSLESLRCVKFGARYCVVGWTSTPFAAGGRGAGGNQSTANVLPTNLIMMKGLRVLGCPVVIHTGIDPSIRAPRLAGLQAMLEAGQLSPHVSHSFDLEASGEGVRASMLARWHRQVVGGCTVRPPVASL